MAADGRILIDTKIDTKGMVNGTDEVIQASRRMAKQVDGLSASVRAAFSRQADSIQKAARAYDEQKEKVEGLRQKLTELRNQQMPTEEYKNLESELSEAEKAMEKIGAQSGKLDSINAKIKKLSQSAAEYKAEMEKISKQKAPTKEYATLTKELNGQIEKIKEWNSYKQEQSEKGLLNEAQLKFVNNRINETEQKIKNIASEMKRLDEAGKAFTFGTDTEKYGKLSSKYESVNNELKEQQSIYSKIENEQANVSNRVDDIRIKMQKLVQDGKAFTMGDTAAIESTTTKLTHEEARLAEMNRSLTTSYDALRNKVNEYGEKVHGAGNRTEKAADSTKKLSSATKKSSNDFKGFGRMMLRYGIGVESLYALINKLRAALVEGFKNLAQYSDNTNATLSGLMSSLAQCKNALATAFDPILQAVAPALNYLISLVTAAATAVAQLIAILTGKGTFIKATKVQKDYAKALKGTGGAAKEAEGALAAFDKLNVMPDQNAGGGGGGAGAGIEDMFETVEVSDSLKGIGKILADLFKPFKEAWKKDGQAVIDAAKYALSSMGELAKSVGKSFMEVWTNGTGTKVVSELLQITTNLLTVVGNIATRLNIAWNTNKVGTRIIQNIFDIFISILDTINRITASTARWAEKLDFAPLLESINTLLEAVKPLTDTIGEGLEWFWNNVLLPIAGWTIEEAVPSFLNMLASAIDALNKVIDALKPAATWFWDNFLEPAGKWTGGVIISAMEKITELLEKFAGWITENQDLVSQFGVIVGTLTGAFIAANVAIGIISGALPILAAAISGVVSVITGPVGIILALAAMVTAAGNGEEMIKNLKDTLEGMKDFVVGVFTGDWERAWSGAKQAVTGAIDAIKLAIESAITLIDRLMGRADRLGEIEITENKNRRSTNVKTAKYGFKSLPRMAQGYSSQPVHLPRLASGTVVPPRAGEFAAILGDNRRETEVVSPLSTIKQALVEAMIEAGGMGSGNITAKIYLDSRELGRSTVNFVRDEKNRTGQNPLLV